MLRLPIVFILLFGAFAWAEGPQVLTFTQWKDRQIIEAHNRVARLANRLTLARNDAKAQTENKSLETELQSAIEALDITKEFTIDHYVATYFMMHVESREAILGLVKSSSEEETADLLAAVLREKVMFKSSTRAAALAPLSKTNKPPL